jgi:hypothetical protein
MEEAIYERQSEWDASTANFQVYKQQKARQLNDGTFESRIHQGFEGAKNKEDQGELFGIHNLLKFDPDGFVSKNVSLGYLLADF